MKAAEKRRRMLVEVLVNQLREDYHAFVSIQCDFNGNVQSLELAVPLAYRDEAFPLFIILRNYLAPAYRKRRKIK